jgi:RNA polymerase sigma-70 factor (ECF subfamily)
VSPANDSTALLIERVRQGDTEALDHLLRRYTPALKRWAHGRLPQWVRKFIDTEDLVQDTLMQTIRRLDAFDPRGEGAFQAYLRAAVMNRVKNEVRNATRRPTVENLDSGAPSEAASPLEAVITQQGLERYDRALMRLSESDRDAVVSRVEFGMTYQEIAAAQGRPSAVAARMAVGRALVRLAEELRRDGISS